jgi:hypothetical protein
MPFCQYFFNQIIKTDFFGRQADRRSEGGCILVITKKEVQDTSCPGHGSASQF